MDLVVTRLGHVLRLSQKRQRKNRSFAKTPRKMSVEHDDGVFPPPLDTSETITWDVDHDFIEQLGVDVDAFIVRLWVREGCPFFERASAVHLAGAWTPGRDPSTMKGKVQLATAPALLYVDQVYWVMQEKEK